MKLRDGTTIEFDVASRQTEIQGVGSTRTERHPQDKELICIWITMPPLPEFPMEQIWLNHTEPHPDASKANYLCELQYVED
jgi:hypothetical protein